MDILIIINAACAAALCLFTGWVIVTPRIHEGPLIKAGLCLLSVGLFGVGVLLPALADEPRLRPLMNALLIGNCGFAAVVGGLAWRILHRPDVREAVAVVTGWPDLADDRRQGERRKGAA